MNNKTDLSKFNNNWYRPGNKALIVAWFIANRVFVNTYLPIPMFVKRLVLKTFGCEIGSNVVFKPKVNIKYPWLLKIGNHVWIGENVWIDNLAEITIGNNVCLSQGAMLLTGNHDYSKPTFDLIVKPIVIHEGVWIGAKSVVCPGITCQSHAVLSVGSVATKDLEPYRIYQGIPAVAIRERNIT
jgi:putative colanic acid biosynthesis acetyltransferase WcaF